MKHKWWFQLGVLVALLVCAGAWGNGEVRSHRDRSKVAQLTEKMKTVCVGRYLINVPSQADVSQSHATVAGFEIQTIGESEAEFHKRIEAREAGIAARGPATDGTGGLIEARDLRIPGVVGRTFLYGLNRGYLMKGDVRVEDEFVSVEAHAHVDGRSFTLTAKYADEARARLADALLARLQSRGENDIPRVPGICIDRGLFAEPLPVREADHSVLHIGLPDHPDLGMAFVSMPGGGNDPDLLVRSAETDASESTAESLRVTKLRADKRNINGLAGEELLERFREINFTTTFAFMWETRGVDSDPMRPFLSLELQAGIGPENGGMPAGSSLHEDAVLDLWGAISSSIRLRPHALPEPRPGANANANAGNAMPGS
jgi:hypothetical protein